MTKYANLLPGDPAPYFIQRSNSNPRYAFDTAAGRYLVLCFAGTFGDAHAQTAIAAVRSRNDLFNDRKASFFAVSADPADEAQARIAVSQPGYRCFWDLDFTACRLYGAVPVDMRTGSGASVAVRRLWVVIDPTMRIRKVIPFQDDRADIEAVIGCIAALPPPERFAGVELQAPIILLPNVLEPELCSSLVSLYEAHGGEDSGFMREVAGKTVVMTNHAHKRRRDYLIEDQALIGRLKASFLRRVAPEIEKVHQFKATRMERYIVACYSANEAAHFQPHRDNTTRGTAHRRFAVSVNLNDDFDGGDVSFPEYGPRSFRPPIGGALVFSCSLLHAVSTVTRGKRYAFLPFLYDDAAAQIREQNNAFLGEGVSAYKA